MQPTRSLVWVVLLLEPHRLFAQTWEPIAPVLESTAAREYAAGINVGSIIVVLGGKPFTSPNEGDGVVHALTNGDWSTPPHLDGEGPLIRQGAGVDDLGRIIFFGGVREGDGEPGHARVYDLVLGVRQSIAPTRRPKSSEGLTSAASRSPQATATRSPAATSRLLPAATR